MTGRVVGEKSQQNESHFRELAVEQSARKKEFSRFVRREADCLAMQNKELQTLNVFVFQRHVRHARARFGHSDKLPNRYK